MSSVYILYSITSNNYYIGFTSISVEERLERHNNNYYANKFTQKSKDWSLYLEIKCFLELQQKEGQKI